MKKIFEVITYMAAFAFFLSLCSIETLDAKVLATLLLSGLWLLVAMAVHYELRNERNGR